jgi:hypothetical protein
MKNFAKDLVPVVLVMILVYSISTNAQWVQTSGAIGSNIECFTAKNSDIYAGYNDGVNSGGVIKSTNYGIDWTNVNTGLPSVKIMALTTSDNNLFTSEYDGGVYLSTDDGANWNITGLTVEYIYGFAKIGTNLFAASTVNGVYLSTDNGTSWNLVNPGLTNTEIRAIYAKGSNLFVGTRGGGVFLSTNNGSNWTQMNNGLTMKYVYALTSIGSTLFAGTWNAGVYRSTNDGANWTVANNGLTTDQVFTLVPSGTNLFATLYGSGVFLSTNNGDNWSEVNNGLTSLSLRGLAVCGSHLYTGGDSSGVWRRPLSEMITDVNDNQNDLPIDFNLSQNYPNPFNPSTKISWQSPVGSWQTLKIIDVLGNEVATLVNEFRSAGTYEVEFEASSINRQTSSGIYFYQLKAGDYIQTKKMILMK